MERRSDPTVLCAICLRIVLCFVAPHVWSKQLIASCSVSNKFFVLVSYSIIPKFAKSGESSLLSDV